MARTSNQNKQRLLGEDEAVPVSAEIKYWWQSRTIWVQVVAIAFALATKLGFMPADISQEDVVLAIMGLIGAINVVLRFVTSSPVRVSG